MKNLLLILLLGSTLHVDAQTFNYTSLGSGYTGCNVFNASLKVINGHEHWPVSGGVSYSSGLILNTLGGTSNATTYGVNEG